MATAKKTKTEATPHVTNNVTLVQPAQLPAFNAADWGMPAVNAKDVVIPKILAMQAMSKKVTAGEAKFGEFRESLNGKVMAEAGKTEIEFIPFYLEKVWIIFEEKQGTMKFVKTVKITPDNEEWPYEEVLNGVKIKRDRTMNFYVLLAKDLEQGNAIPHILSFRRTSMRAGQKLATTMFLKNINAGKCPAATVCALKGDKQQNDKGTFIVMDVYEKRESTAKEINDAFSWVKTVTSGKTKVDDSDLEAEATEMGSHAAPAEGETSF